MPREFIVPFFAYYFTGEFFSIFLIFAYIPILIMWHLKLDKKLVFTWRVKRFFILLISLTMFQNFLCILSENCQMYGVLLPLLIAYIGSTLIEMYLFLVYKKEASKKLEVMSQLKIVCITGSYGKTSMKNFINQTLSQKYKTHMSPRSVNTIAGLIRDINENLEYNTKVYVCEAGARERGDILEIAKLLNPQIVVVGKVGPQHIEYFKNMETIKRTKLELIQSNRLEIAFVHNSVTDEYHSKVKFFGDGISNLEATLEKTEFDLSFGLNTIHVKTDVLGSFQAINLEAVAMVASTLGFQNEEIEDAMGHLKSVEHRLERIDVGGKLILDDSYNGNLDGMLEGVRLCALHVNGKKVIVTPGLVEADDDLNLKLIEAINEVFDLVVVTGKLNRELFDLNLKVPQKIIIADKEQMKNILARSTHSGDIIYFANDAPSFI
ncbi:MAG: UDP-N-acetylmuramoyl-tripeptide--D-alanyl-D-alanine ligase [Campylobacterota bacterium]|nr:UDP-N-acetylmuramoyl-tripeptide--D-alanyl-D-alanine ligase [Campylobacterota bacterium]